MIHWDPPREMFNFALPILERPILWYGFLFALGFYLGFLILRSLMREYLSDKKKADFLSEKICFYAIVGTVVGARLGDVLFYQGTFTDIVKVWEGGLSSHGGAIGVFIGLWLFKRKYKPFSFLTLLDLVVLPTGLVAFFIRLGNFMNQEILGTITDLPWAVSFGHPVDGILLPRHPVQLYEAFTYLALFGLLFWLWKRPEWKTPGKISGLFFVLLFSARFLLEFVKMEQSNFYSSFLTMGQLLSIPFVVSGILIYRRKSSLQ